MKRRRILFLAALAVLALAPVAGADVKVKTAPDGSKIIFNESALERERRFGTRLVEVPREELAGVIDRHARAQQLEPKLVRAIIQAESGYKIEALSNKGAMGLMQLMPATARDLSVTDPYDAEQNVRGGTAYFRAMLDRFEGRLELALAAYNAGPGAVDKYNGVPPYRETRDYVRRILTLYHGKPVEIPAAVASSERRGRKPHVTRVNGKIVITTDP